MWCSYAERFPFGPGYHLLPGNYFEWNFHCKSCYLCDRQYLRYLLFQGFVRSKLLGNTGKYFGYYWRESVHRYTGHDLSGGDQHSFDGLFINSRFSRTATGGISDQFRWYRYGPGALVKYCIYSGTGW